MKSAGKARHSPPCVLTIAGSDSGAGAGIQADARVMQAMGVHACTAITCVTAQNTLGISGAQAVPAPLIAQQIRSVLSDMPVRAIKTGLLPSAAAILAIARVLQDWPPIPLIIDPVLVSSSGHHFLDTRGRLALQRHLLPRAALITPNRDELGHLTGLPTANAAEALLAALHLANEAGCAVLAKGGHSGTARCDDILVHPDGTQRVFKGRRIDTPNTHGTGCALSAGIAAGLALGNGLEYSIQESKRLLSHSLSRNRKRIWGQGAGPAFA